MGGAIATAGVQPKGRLPMNQRALAAEFIGTFALVGAVCGSALFSAPAGGGLVGVAFAVGLSVLAMAYAVGHISGGHFNPAVTIGLIAGGRFKTEEAIPYIIAQVAGGLAAALVFSMVLGGAPGGATAPKWNSFMAISNNFGGPGGFSMQSAFVIELVITALFLIVIMGATSKRAPAGFAACFSGFVRSTVDVGRWSG